MKVLKFIFVRITRKIFCVIACKLEYCYYLFLYSGRKIKDDFTQKRYLICNGENPDDIADAFYELFGDKIETKIFEADLICRHVFELLGSGPKDLGNKEKDYQPIDWHTDFKSGYRWNPKTFHRNIRFGNVDGVDVKVPWELSRFQHLNSLGQAYILTKDKKYAEEFSNQISDWIKNNPVAFGVNWKCTMDVAIRAANWLTAMEYFTDEKPMSKEFLREFYTSIYEHGRFIYSHLEYSSKSATNHYIADIAGLFFISVYCPFFKESKDWRKFAIQQLCEQIEKQVYSDGCGIEASTSYHRLVLEMFFYCGLLCRRAGIEIPAQYLDILRRMFEFSLYCIKPDGYIPQIGDNDSGRFLIFTKRPILEHKYLLTLACLYFEDSSFKLPQFCLDEESFWLFGKDSRKLYERLALRKYPPGPKSFPDAGWFIIRHNNDHCFICCGPNNRKLCLGHNHNDILSFELMLNGRNIIIDPGAYIYTPYPEERNKFRSTKYHNTIQFDDSEQNSFIEKDLFSLLRRVKIKNAVLRETQAEIIFEGEIEYTGTTHKRTVVLNKEQDIWQIRDCVSCPEPENIKLIFHLPPNLTAYGNDIFLKGTNNIIASIKVEGHSLEKGEYDFSPEYGVKIPAEFLAVNISEIQKKQTITTYILKHKVYTNKARQYDPEDCIICKEYPDIKSA